MYEVRGSSRQEQLHNEKFHKLYSSPNIVDKIQCHRRGMWNWGGEVKRNESMPGHLRNQRKEP